ncbi:bifunctional phosphoribosylaminoimidazolecarboxamide formyltransferase/IMP cyclohydrolase [Flavobacteriaceae bacterium]|jgi:phosphoribosylaminoimidazolecarboxamide formyltransferase/IMP cyclohydrolase|nr:bifunctional phosphoribosylaminoimidazolecarboxamide formyltransferase/IMP cyclohydrolase [Flavobacteriaceae bacterium]MDC3297469.1 bifunctional phosphoribosylaminoimidazolecarboxamide formyltransferase/IMP cyclohydrolase [Flavobacteriaceae bacterium]
MKKIKSALISVFNKDKIDEICSYLSSNNVIIYSTGGTYNYISNLGIPVKKVEDLTSFPSILNGRVKTLHPKVFGGILRTNSESDIEDSKNYDIPIFDLVIVDLYPFEETLKTTKKHNEIIEKIDIGGVSLIRAAAKNYENVTCISSSSQYDKLIKIIKEDCSTDISFRKTLAFEAFEKSSTYDSIISGYLNPEYEKKNTELRYGENPHQKGRFIGDLKDYLIQLNGKEISYNNLLDIDASLDLLRDLESTKAVFLIHKHNNPCGVAIRDSITEAYEDALACDNISAFGGVLTSNKKVDKKTADQINKLFFEILIAPDFDDDALDLLKSRKNRILIKLNKIPIKNIQKRSCLNGFLEQDIDNKIENFGDFKVVTNKTPNNKNSNDLVLASIIAKHTKSNCIAIVKNQQLIGSGMGQVSRIDALEQAIEKSKRFGFELNQSTLASDAFFPFSDCVEISFKNGIDSIVQPGGSVRDQDSIDFCNENQMSMVFSGIRHFRH